MKVIGKSAFEGLSDLKDIYICSKRIKKVYQDAFLGVSPDAIFHFETDEYISDRIAKIIMKSGYPAIKYYI